MGQTPGRPTVPQPARPRARARRLVVGLGRRRRLGHRRSRARHRRGRQRAPPRRGLRRRRVQADLRLGPARRLHALRAELRHRRSDRAQRRGGRAAALGDRGRAARRPLRRASTACASRSSAATSRPRSRTTSRELLERARGRVDAPEIEHRLEPDRQPLDGADLHGRARRVRARATTPRRPSGPTATTRRRSPTSRPRAACRRSTTCAAAASWPRRGAAARAAAAGFDILLCASAPCAPVPIDGPDKTTRMNALTKPFNALGWPAVSLPGRLRPRRPPARAAGRRPPGERRGRAAGGVGARRAPSGLRALRADPRDPRMASRLRSTSSSVVAQDDTLMRIAVRPCQTVMPHQHVPSACTPATTRCVSAGSPNETSTWLRTTSLRISWPAARRPSAKRAAWRQLRSIRSSRPLRPERAERGPDVDAARPARELRRVVGRIAQARLGRQVLGGDRHRRAQRLGVAHEREAAVVGDVQPLVAVGRPRVGEAEALDEVRPARGCGGPQAEGAVDVQPGARRARRLGDRRQRVERAGVEVAGLRAHDGGRRERRQRLGPHAPLPVHGHAHEAVAAEADEPERLDQRRMRLLADHDGDRRRAEQPVGLDVPALRARAPRGAPRRAS